MLLAHCAGLFAVAIAATVTGSDPGLFRIITTFSFGFVLSSILFAPILVVTLVFAPTVIARRVPFLLLGPVIVTSLWAGMALDFSEFLPWVGLSSGVSSLVLFRLLRAAGLSDPPAAAD